MKKKLLLIVLTFLIWTVIFTLQKPFFLIFYGGFSQVFNVVRHGLKLDLSTAAYLTAIPSIILLISSIPIKCLSGAKAGKLLMDIVVLHQFILGRSRLCSQFGLIWLLELPP